MKRMMHALFVLVLGLMTSMAWADATIPGSMSDATEECLGCHADDNPGPFHVPLVRARFIFRIINA